MKKIKCELCGYDIDTHQIKKHKNYCNGLGPKRLRKKPGHHGWNKGLTTSKETRDNISKALIGKSTGRALTPEKETERKHNISKTMVEKRLGGYRKGSGRGKQGRYKGIWCDSSWELAWVLYHLDNNILFERNNKKFEYFFNDLKYTYTPDFKIKDSFIEIKGYVTEQVKAKINQFPEKLIILQKSEMKIYLEYAIKKYGKDFIKLYEAISS